MRPGRNTPTLKGGPVTAEIHPQQFEWTLAIQPENVGFQRFFNRPRAWTETDDTAFVAAIWTMAGAWREYRREQVQKLQMEVRDFLAPGLRVP